MGLPVWLRETDGGVDVSVIVVPRASRTRVVGVHDDMLRVQLAAPPVDGAANDALVRFVAESTGTPRSSVSVARGLASRRKTVRLAGVDGEQVRRALEVP
jgi:hypothetical protein